VSAVKEFCVAGTTVVRIMAGYYLHDRRVCSEGILCCGHDGHANNNFVKLMHFKLSTDWLLAYKENATRCSRDRPSLHTPRDYHDNPRALVRRILIGYLSGCI
jgi:hypothetical protein